MGGAVRVIIREEDGTVHKQTRHTNFTPNFVMNPLFTKGDKEHIKKYLKKYNKESQGSGLESERLAPYDYGIMVFDFMEKKMYSAQDYSDFNSFITSGLGMCRDGYKKCADDENEYLFAKQYEKEGNLNITEISFESSQYGKEIEYNLNDSITLDDALQNQRNRYSAKEAMKKLVRKARGKSPIAVMYEFTPNYKKLGWEIMHEHVDSEWIFKIFKELVKGGFELTLEEIQLWSDFIEVNEDEDEDIKNEILTYVRDTKIKTILS